MNAYSSKQEVYLCWNQHSYDVAFDNNWSWWYAAWL